MGSLYRDETGGLVALKPIFPKLEEKKSTKCHGKVYDEVVACWGGGFVVPVFGELDLCITRTVAALAHCSAAI